MKTIRVFSIVLMLVAAIGCTSSPSRTDESSTTVDQLVSRDLVNVLMQVDVLNPQAVLLLLPESLPAQGAFSEALVSSLQAAGYSIRNEGVDSRTLAVSYSVDQSFDVEKGEVRTYTVNMGNVSVRRSYQGVNSGKVIPLARMQIRGADASKVSLSNDIFTSSPGQLTPAPPPAAPVTALVPAPAPVHVPAPVPVPVETAPEVVAVVPVPLPSPIPRENQLLNTEAPTVASPSIPQPTQDVQEATKQSAHNLGDSGYADIFESFGTVNELVLIFANDSTALGSENKERVNEVVTQFDQTLDVFSVVGCSSGSATLSGGERLLAQGRSESIKEELRVAGVPESKILDEACWDSEHSSTGGGPAYCYLGTSWFIEACGL